jgi:Protein of unknown function (DUF3261)
MKWGWAILAAIALNALSCTGASPQPARLHLQLAPASLGRSLSLQQHLTVESPERIDELDVALEVDAERLDLVGLALGQRIFALHYDGHSLQSWRHPLVPEQLRGADVLEDLQLTLWPLDVIKKALPEGWDIEDLGRRRTLRWADHPVLVIDYSGDPRWSGKIQLTNLQYQYCLTIQSVSSAP